MMCSSLMLCIGHPFAPPADYAPKAPAYVKGVPWPTLSTARTATVQFSPKPVRNGTPYVFGTNVPVYWGRKYSRQPEVRAKLAAVASLLRWPGGSSANQYIWDGNWSAHPYFEKRFKLKFGSNYIQTADELILTCKATGAEPLVQMNAAVALVESVPAAIDLSLRLLRKLTAAGLHVRHVSFGNENYGEVACRCQLLATRASATPMPAGQEQPNSRSHVSS